MSLVSVFIQADEGYCIGPAPSNESYLVMDKIMDVARSTNAQVRVTIIEYYTGSTDGMMTLQYRLSILAMGFCQRTGSSQNCVIRMG